MIDRRMSRTWFAAAVVGGLIAVVAILTILRGERPSPGPTAASQPTTASAVSHLSGKWVEAADASPDAVATYVADFQTERPAEFSRGGVQFTAKGRRPFLGRFDQKGVQFTIDKAPPHRFVRVVFDLAVLHSWNGSSRIWGPDVLNVRVIDGPELLNATFCNCGFFDNNNEQSYPDQFPMLPGAKPHPGWTGAAERQTLGEIQRFTNANPIETQDTSSVYRMEWVFPHDADTLSIDFTAKFKDRSMRFGLMNFRVEAIETSASLAPDQLDAAWEAMTGTDPIAANSAVWQLTATPEQAVALITARVPANAASTLSPYGKSRIAHVLHVVNTPASLKLAAAIAG